MMEEFEEPYSISFQTDSLHSGSISFGRFEREDLSWERRSSFSHNRYLEEVEKCSKPGSVIEKKAYFEAHFKQKGMQLPASFGGQNGIEYHGENAVFENVGHKEEDDNANGSSNYTQFEEGALENVEYAEFYDGYARGEFDHANDSGQYAHFDDSPEGSEYCGECQVMECEREDPESQIEASSVNANVFVEGVFEDIKPQEAHQTVTGPDDNERQEIGIKENLNDNAANVDTSSRPFDPSPKSGTLGSDKTTAVHQQNLSPKLRVPMESKHSEPRLKSQANANQVQKANQNDALKTTVKKLNWRERESPQRMKSEKHSPQAAIPTRRSVLRTPKGEDFEVCNSRSNLANKSEKDPKIKKVVEAETSGSKKVEPRARQSLKRSKQTVSSAKPDTRTSTVAFNFRSDERAERRKEFYMKLEEKMHAKETEMNQIQAKTQTEAEIKQFRKSLNFKAIPMPSFYHAAASPGSNGNKATSSKTKPAKIQQKPVSPGSGAASRSQLFSKSGNNHAVSAVEPVNTSNLPESLGPTDCHAIAPSEAGERETLARNNSSHPEAALKNGCAGKDLEKVKNTNLQRHKVSENGKVSKDQRVEGRPKMGNRRNSSEMVRKSIKGVGIGSNSGVGRVAVGVAS
ncbi:protein WVD2-like 7 isoform X2 [Hevea brasiliensis]|uniref:protein WVD2-like 7 isoform X2 n=1 Tax=Hevea brasiliensis TaxID=3981 RepID=UPI0025E756D0|nr:protein WVD2-like 7 isoform X2 [Hevea brasiliensis]